MVRHVDMFFPRQMSTMFLPVVRLPQDTDLLLRHVPFAIHGLGPFYWPRPTLNIASKFSLGVSIANVQPELNTNRRCPLAAAVSTASRAARST